MRAGLLLGAAVQTMQQGLGFLVRFALWLTRVAVFVCVVVCGLLLGRCSCVFVVAGGLVFLSYRGMCLVGSARRVFWGFW